MLAYALGCAMWSLGILPGPVGIEASVGVRSPIPLHGGAVIGGGINGSLGIVGPLTLVAGVQFGRATALASSSDITIDEYRFFIGPEIAWIKGVGALFARAGVGMIGLVQNVRDLGTGNGTEPIHDGHTVGPWLWSTLGARVFFGDHVFTHVMAGGGWTWLRVDDQRKHNMHAIAECGLGYRF